MCDFSKPCFLPYSNPVCREHYSRKAIETIQKPKAYAASKAEFTGPVGAKVPKTINSVRKNQEEMYIFIGPHRLRLPMNDDT